MSKHEMPPGGKRSKEEEYFHKKDQELIEKARRRGALRSEAQAMADAVGISDENVLSDLRELGYTAETVPLLYLVPMVQMAWAEGWVTERERELIFEAARLRGIHPCSQAHQKLSDWLYERPTDDFFGRTLRVIGAILMALPAEEREAYRNDLVSQCARVAGISGGVVRFLTTGTKISKEERVLIQRITKELASFGNDRGP